VCAGNQPVAPRKSVDAAEKGALRASAVGEFLQACSCPKPRRKRRVVQPSTGEAPKGAGSGLRGGHGRGFLWKGLAVPPNPSFVYRRCWVRGKPLQRTAEGLRAHQAFSRAPISPESSSKPNIAAGGLAAASGGCESLCVLGK